MPQCVGLSCRFSGRATIRGELALKRKHIIAAKARENQACGQGGVLLLQNSAKASEKVDTRAELAKIAGVSHDTIARVEKIVQKAPAKARENQAQYFGNQYQSGLCQNSAKVHPINTRAEVDVSAPKGKGAAARLVQLSHLLQPART